MHRRNGRQVDANVAHIDAPLVAQEEDVGVDLIRRRRNCAPLPGLAEASILLELLLDAGLPRKCVGADLVSDQEQSLM